MPFAPTHIPNKLAHRLAPASSTSGRKLAFTLVELLTVIAIIGILAAIIIPVVGKVRQSARQAHCASRMRDLGSGFALFANENKGTLPYSVGTFRWWKQLAIYVVPPLGEARASATDSAKRTQIDQQIADTGFFKCPTVEAATKGTTTGGILLYNWYLDIPARNYAPVQVERIAAPSRLPVLSTAAEDCGAQIMFNASGGVLGPHPKAKDFGYSGDTNDAGPSPNFGNKAVFLFADWHVSSANVCNRNEWPWKDTSIFHPW